MKAVPSVVRHNMTLPLVIYLTIKYSRKFSRDASPWSRNIIKLSKATVLLLLIYCLMYFPLLVKVLRLSLFCYALLCVHSSLAIILKRKRKLVALLLLSYRCIVTINVLWLFITVPLVGCSMLLWYFMNILTYFLHSNKNVQKFLLSRQSDDVNTCSTTTVKPVLSGHSKRRPKLVIRTDYRLMQVKSIAECSKRAFCNAFDLH